MMFSFERLLALAATLLLVSQTAAYRFRAAPPAAAVAAAPGPAPAGAPGEEIPMVNMKHIAEMLPFRPNGQNYDTFKGRCTNFVNHMLDRSGHDTDLLVRSLPNCTWGQEQCKQIEDDLVARIKADTGAKEDAAPDGAVDFLQSRHTRIIPAWAQGTQGVFGWCDTVWNIARERGLQNVKEDLIPAKARAKGVDEPMPLETGNHFIDAKNLHKWAKENLG